jgi:hypothetical protein
VNTPLSCGTGTDNSLALLANGYIAVAAMHTTGANAIVSTEFDQVYFTSFATGVATLNGPHTLSFPDTCMGQTIQRLFTITGNNLHAGSLTVSPLAGFAYSLTGNDPFTSSLSIPQNGGAFTQPVTIRFSPTSVQSYDGQIEISGGGANAVVISIIAEAILGSPMVSSLPATAITATEATIQGNISHDGCSGILSAGVEYSTTDGFSNGAGTIVTAVNPAMGEFEVHLTGLTPGITYYYKTFAGNSPGTTYSSPQGSFTTLASEPSNHPSAFSCGTTTQTTITLNWLDGIGTVPASGYLIKWSTINFADIADPVDGIPEPNNTISANVNAGIQMLSIPDLSPGTVYYFKIYPYSNSGSSIDYKTGSGISQTTCSTISGPLAAWDFTGLNNTATATATIFHPNLLSSNGMNNLTRGPGANPSAGANSFRTTGFRNDGIVVTNTDYFQVMLVAQPGMKLSLHSIDAIMSGTAAFTIAPGVSSQFAYSLDGINYALIHAPVITEGQPVVMPTIDLSGVAALQNVSSDTISIRYYASGQSTTGGWGFFSSSPGMYGLSIAGTVTPAITLPVDFEYVKATHQSGGIRISWCNPAESEIDHYRIERSANGSDFSLLERMEPRSNDGEKEGYDYMDTDPHTGTNFYRIVLVRAGDLTAISKVVRVDMSTGFTKLMVYPNPSERDQLGYQVLNLPGDKYHISVINLFGQEAYCSEMDHPGGTVSGSINLPAGTGRGIYTLVISNKSTRLVTRFVRGG